MAEALALSARCFEKTENWTEAAENYRNAGKPLDAARCFEKGDNLQSAAESFLEANCSDDYLRCTALLQMTLGEFNTAAELFAEAAEYAWWDSARTELLALAEECKWQAESSYR
jgi:hypothetical protein